MRHEHTKATTSSSHKQQCIWIRIALCVYDCCTAVLLFKAIREGCHMFCSSCCVVVCVHRAYPVYCRVLCTCHNNMYPDPPDRKYTQLWDIMYQVSYHTSTFELYTYTYAREFEPGWSAPFLLLWDLPSFCQFCRLALSGFYRLTRLSGFLAVIFS